MQEDQGKCSMTREGAVTLLHELYALAAPHQSSMPRPPPLHDYAPPTHKPLSWIKSSPPCAHPLTQRLHLPTHKLYVPEACADQGL